MGLHGSDNRHMVTPHGSVAKKGVKSYELGDDQIGLFSKKSVEALGSTQGISKDEKLVLRQGKRNLSKNLSTLPFTLGHVKKVTVGLPKVAEQKTDYFRIGWDGVHKETSLKFYKGDAWNIEIMVTGQPVAMMNMGEDYTFTVPVVTDGPKYGLCLEEEGLCDLVPCQDKTIELVKTIKDKQFPTGQKFSEYFDVYPIFDTPSNPDNTVEYTQYCLEYCGFGDANELSKVSAQYPGYKVTKDTMTGKFVVMLPTEDGAPEDYKVTLGSIVKGCEDCPEGYDLIEGGFVYAITVEDNGEDVSANLEDAPNIIVDSIKKVGQDYGVGYYVAAFSKKLTSDQINTLAGAESTDTTSVTSQDGEVGTFETTSLDLPGVRIKLVGEVADVCESDTVTTHKWSACGTCDKFEGKYRVMIADDCKGARLEEVQARYPDLEITKVKTQNCVSIYEATVPSDFSCSEGCNDEIVQQLFDTVRPEPFSDNAHWYPVSQTTENTDVSCGIEIKAKPFIVDPSEFVEKDVPFMATSIQIKSISGGYMEDFTFGARQRDLVNVLQLEKAQDLDNLGGNLKEFERRGNFYFLNQRYSDDPTERYFEGSQSKLKNLDRVADITLTIHTMLPQSMNMATPKAITYHVFVPVGKHKEVEELFTNIAGSANAQIEYI